MDFDFRFRQANRTEEGFYFGLVQPRIFKTKPKFFFFCGRGKMRSVGEGEGHPRSPTGVDEEMEEVEKGEEDSISNVCMDAGQGTFIVDTVDPTVATVRVVSKKTNTVMVKEDILSCWRTTL